MNPISLILNILWLLLGGGLVAALTWLLAGGILAITVIGLPFAFAAFRIANFTAFPFGRELQEVEEVGEERITGTTLANVLWILLAGIWLALLHCLAALTYFITIIGIPFGWAHLKLAGASLAPLGKRIVISD